MGTYKWMNAAGNVWTLSPTSNCAVMGLEVGKDCPYYDLPSAGYYRSAMYNENGIFGPGGEFYTFIGKSDWSRIIKVSIKYGSLESAIEIIIEYDLGAEPTGCGDFYGKECAGCLQETKFTVSKICKKDSYTKCSKSFELEYKSQWCGGKIITFVH